MSNLELRNVNRGVELAWSWDLVGGAVGGAGQS